MTNKLWLLALPSLVVISTALITKNVLMSLTLGIILASLIASHFNPIQALTIAAHRFVEQTDIPILSTGQAPEHMYTLGFIILLGIVIALITHMGGVAAYSNWLRTKLKTKRQTEAATLAFSFSFFLDDYLNAFTTGCVMRPLTDSMRIPRVKLAYLLNAMASSLCVLVPISSWAAFLLSQIPTEKLLTTSGTLEPFSLLVYAIPYFTFPLLSILNAWFIVLKRISFGQMYQYEKIAAETGNVYGGKAGLVHTTSVCEQSGSVYDFFLPLGSFLGLLLGFLLYTGKWSLFGGAASFGQALIGADVLASLFYSVIGSLIFTLAFGLYTKKLNWPIIQERCIEGFNLMKNSVFLLLLAWTFSALLQKDLAIGTHLEAFFQSMPAGPLLAWLPLVSFALSMFVSASIGSTWGTITLLVPLIITIGTSTSTTSVLNLAQILGALLSGAVAGSQVSFISDAGIIASTGARAHHYSHVITQMPYALPAIIATSAVLLINTNFYIGLAVALTLSWTLLLIQNKNKDNRL